VPKPASASSSAPKEKAMITAWMRWSSEIAPNERRSTAKCPDSSVMLKIQIAFQTIHMIGNRPKAAPSSAASSAWPAGIPYASTATSSATSSDKSPAQCDLSLSPPSSTNSVANGIIATSALRNSESPTGSSTCLYMRLSSQGNPGRRSTHVAANANAPRKP
jgi:hypothetical protein